MMTAFRRFAGSPIGLAVFAVILIAFVVTLYEGKSAFGGRIGSGGGLASVGGVGIGETDARRRVQNQLDAARQQKPEIDMAGFVADGGADQTIEQMINAEALAQFAAANGLIASRKLVDGAIASVPAFNGPDGKFDRTAFLAILSQRKIPEAQVRTDFEREAITRMLLGPVAGGGRVPTAMVLPYASLMLEVRQGQIGVVPSAAFASNTPVSDGELNAFYKRNIARYTVPERRVIKLAQFDRTRFEASATPSEAEVAGAYKAAAGKYAGRELRAFTQVIVPAQRDAAALLAKVRAGARIDEAAKALGLEALAVPANDKAAFAKLTGPRVADAAFAAAKGGFSAVEQSGLGYHVVRVDSVTEAAQTTLAQARPAIVAELVKTKTDEALADFITKVEDEINGGATFDEVAQKYGMAATATPAITASGIAPNAPDFKLPAELQPLLRDAFQADPGDDPQIASIGRGTSYALYHMDRVIPAAPMPLGDIRGRVGADVQVYRAATAAKRVADAIAAKVNGGTTFAQALAGAGIALPAPKPAGGRRIDIAQAKEKVPPPLALMFGMVERSAKVLAVPQGAGWFIVYLDRITPGDARVAPPLIEATQKQLAGVVGNEYVEQFAAAARARVGVTRNPSALAAFKKSLTGGAAGQ